MNAEIIACGAEHPNSGFPIADWNTFVESWGNAAEEVTDFMSRWVTGPTYGELRALIDYGQRFEAWREIFARFCGEEPATPDLPGGVGELRDAVRAVAEETGELIEQGGRAVERAGKSLVTPLLIIGSLAAVGVGIALSSK